MKALRLTTASLLLFLSLPALASGGHGHSDDENDGHPATEKGPHGGQRLQEADVTLEIRKTEANGLASLQAWVTKAGEPVTKASLAAGLERLDGTTKKLTFDYDGTLWRAEQTIRPPHSFDSTFTLVLDGKHYQWQWPSYEGRVEIAAAMAKKAGIASQIASPGTIAIETQAYGRLTIPPARHAELSARFPGLVTQVRASVGDTVSQGDVLAVIESNDSLRTYSLRAPFDGIIEQRHTNKGQVTGQHFLFTLLNTDQLLAEITLFPHQRGDVKRGQSVTLQLAGKQTQSTLSSLTPSSQSAPVATVTARATLDNDGGFAPGDLVEASIITATHDVALRVDNRALQAMAGNTVVFIRKGEAYESRTVELGRADNRYSEVLSGLNPGAEYVVQGSYLIKADILKAGAAHHH